MTLPGVIQTERLTLQALTESQLRSYLSGGRTLAGGAGSISRRILTPVLEGAVRSKLEKLSRADGEDWLWITYWLIKVPPQGFGAGLIGFKGVPDEGGQVEVGYGIDPGWRSLGYTTEALRGLAGWAFTHSRCRRILAPETARANPASNRVLQKAGFRVYAENDQSISWCLDKIPGEESR